MLFLTNEMDKTKKKTKKEKKGRMILPFILFCSILFSFLFMYYCFIDLMLVLIVCVFVFCFAFFPYCVSTCVPV